MTNKEIYNQLEVVRNKGNYHKTVYKAYEALESLRDEIDRDDWWEIRVALSHMDIGEGAEELNDALKKVTEKYKS